MAMKNFCTKCKDTIRKVYRFIRENGTWILICCGVLYALNIIVKIIRDDGTHNGKPYFEEFGNDYIEPGSEELDEMVDPDIDAEE